MSKKHKYTSNPGQDLSFQNIGQTLGKYKLLDSWPANIKFAKYHMLANKFGYIQSKSSQKAKQTINLKKCPCCEQFVQNNSFGFIFDQQKAIYLGSGVYMFYEMIKILTLYLIIRFLISDVFNLYTNYSGNDCIKCTSNVKMSIQNKINHLDQIGIQHILDLIMVCLSIIYFIFFKRIVTNKFYTLDLKLQSQDDYTVYLKNLPTLFKNEETSKKYEEHLTQKIQNIIYQWIKNNQDHQYKNKVQKTNYENWRKTILQQGKKVSDFNAGRKNIVTGIDLCWDLSQFQKLQNLKELLKDQRETIIQQIKDIKAKIQKKKLKQNKKQQKYLQSEIQKNQQKQNPNQTKDQDQILLSMFQTQQKVLQLNIIRCNQQIYHLSKMFEQSSGDFHFFLTHFIGKAFVKFQYQHFAQYFKTLVITKQISINQFILEGDKAVAPSDIYWKNLKLTQYQKNVKSLIALLITIATLILSFAVLFAISWGKQILNPVVKQTIVLTNKTVQSALSSQKIKGYFLTTVSSILVVITNSILKTILRKLVIYQQKQTQTQHLNAFMWKLLLAQFVNSALIYYITSQYLKIDYKSQNGLIQSVTSLFTTSAAIQILLNAANPTLWMTLLKLKFFYGDQNAFQIIKSQYNLQMLLNTQKGHETYPTYQDRLNKVYQLPSFVIQQRYVYYLLQVYIIAFYGFLVPIGSPIIIIVFLIQFAIDRFNLVRLSTLKVEFDFNLTRFVMKMFESSIFIYGLGNFIFNYHYQKKTNIYTTVSLIISIFYLLLLWIFPYKIQQKIFASEPQNETTPYSQAKKKFKQTYSGQNPGTRQAQSNRHNYNQIYMMK